MGKKEELEELDTVVRRRMLTLIKGGKTDLLAELSVPVSYLSKNNVVEEKTKASVEEDIEKRLKEAQARRDKK